MLKYIRFFISKSTPIMGGGLIEVGGSFYRASKLEAYYKGGKYNQW